jgi:hypothetical protein
MAVTANAAVVDCFSKGTRVLHTHASGVRYSDNGVMIFKDKKDHRLTFVNMDCLVRLEKNE